MGFDITSQFGSQSVPVGLLEGLKSTACSKLALGVDDFLGGAAVQSSQIKALIIGLSVSRVTEKRESCLPLITMTCWFVSRCFEVLCIYCQSGHIEEPYVSITKKRQMPKNGLSEEIEKEVGQAEGKMFTHRSAFSRASVIQAFLGSAPQLTLQLYISTLQQEITVGRCMYTFYLCLNLGINMGSRT